MLSTNIIYFRLLISSRMKIICRYLDRWINRIQIQMLFIIINVNARGISTTISGLSPLTYYDVKLVCFSILLYL